MVGYGDGLTATTLVVDVFQDVVVVAVILRLVVIVMVVMVEGVV